MLLLPVGVATLDLVLRKQPIWQRVMIAGTLCLMQNATCVWYLLIREADSWYTMVFSVWSQTRKLRE